MRVTVLHNDFMKVAMRFPGGYQPGDVLTQVDEFEPALSEGFPPLPDQVVGEIDDEALLEWVFRIHNAVDGDERNVKLGLRSLSTGDAVALEGRLYSCESLGWQRIEEVKS